LKDVDDFDLDTESRVADVFVDEGKAYQDGLDQHATIKVVLKKGQAARHASVVPDLTPDHYQRPPPPRFNAIPSMLGKRRLDNANGPVLSNDARGGHKRSRLAEIAETQEDEVMASVEKSPELIADTQTSPLDNRRNLIKTEPSGLSRRLHDIAPATLDELEYLPEEPPDFHLHARAAALQRNRMASQVNGVPQNAAARAKHTYTSTQLPITPPTDPRSAPQTLKTTRVNGHVHPPGTSEPKSSSHVNKFKSGRTDLYDLPDSDIEDSQMPRPDKLDAGSQLFGRNPMGQKPQSSFSSYNALPDLPPIELDSDADATQAFIAGKRHSVSLHNNFGTRALKPPPAHGNSGEELEILATASEPKELNPTQAQTGLSHPPKPISPEHVAVRSDTDSTNQSRTSERDKRKRRKAKNHAPQSSDGDVVASDEENSQDLDQTSASRRTSTTNYPSRRSSALDSPGEQLSQALQALAKKPSAPALDSNLSNQVSTSSSTSGTGSVSSSRRTSSGSSGSSGRLGLGITDSPKKPSPPGKAVSQPKPAPQKTGGTSKAKSPQAIDEKGKKTKNGKAKKASPVGEVLDLDKQCGVLDAKTRKPCKRAIQNTCHSKSLKRGIPGRSLPLDELLEKIKNGEAIPHAPPPKKTNNMDRSRQLQDIEPKTGDGANSATAVPPGTKISTPPPNPPLDVAPQVILTASPNLILPKGMTAEQFKELRKYNSEHPQPEKPKKSQKIGDTRKATATPDIDFTAPVKTPAPKSKSKSATLALNTAQPSGKTVKSAIPAARAPGLPKSALKNSTSSSSDRRSSSSSSGSSRNVDDLFKNVVAKNEKGTQPATAILEYASRNTYTGISATKKSSTEPKESKAAPKRGSGTTPSAVTTSKATPAPPTSSAPTLPAITPTPAPPAVPNLLKNLKNQMRANRARDSAQASPAPGFGSNMSDLGTKPLFGIGEDESSDESSDEESDSEKENEEPTKSVEHPKADDKKNGTAKAVSEGSGSSEASESEEDDEDEDEDDYGDTYDSDS
jgi:hypothetical protein